MKMMQWERADVAHYEVGVVHGDDVRGELAPKVVVRVQLLPTHTQQSLSRGGLWEVYGRSTLAQHVKRIPWRSAPTPTGSACQGSAHIWYRRH